MLRMVVKMCMGESCRAEAGEDGASGCEECAQHDGMVTVQGERQRFGVAGVLAGGCHIRAQGSGRRMNRGR